MNKVTEQNNPDLITLGGRIEHERRLKNMSQEELAELLNVQRQKISYVEKNTPNRNLSIEELKKVADVLDVSTDYLLGRISSKNSNDFDISKSTGLNADSITILKNIFNNNQSNILNSFLCSVKLEELTNMLEQYMTITYITDILFRKTFLEIEMNYKNKKEIIATPENINNLKSFINYIDKLKYPDTKELNMFTIMLHSCQKELDVISKICIDLENNNGAWYENEKPDFNTYKSLNKTFNSYTDYLLFIIVEQKLKSCIEELGKQATQDKNIHSELKLLKNEN